MRPQAPLAWNRDEPGLGLSLTRRPPAGGGVGGGGRPGSEGLLCRLCHRMSVGPATAGQGSEGDGAREEGERRDEILAAGQGGIPNRRWRHRKWEWDSGSSSFLGVGEECNKAVRRVKVDRLRVCLYALRGVLSNHKNGRERSALHASADEGGSTNFHLNLNHSFLMSQWSILETFGTGSGNI